MQALLLRRSRWFRLWLDTPPSLEDCDDAPQAVAADVTEFPRAACSRTREACSTRNPLAVCLVFARKAPPLHILLRLVECRERSRSAGPDLRRVRH